MGQFCKPDFSNLPGSSETVEGTEIPAWVAAAGRGLFQQALNVANTPYPQYKGQRIASYGKRGSKLSSDERKGIDILRKGADSYEPYLEQADKIASTLGGGYDSFSRRELLGKEFKPKKTTSLMGKYKGASRDDLIGDDFTIEDAQPFMDIYQEALDPSIDELGRQIETQTNRLALSAGGQGAFGGRLGLLEGSAISEGAGEAAKLRADASRQGLDVALSQRERDRAARFGAEDTMRSQFEADRAARIGLEDARYGRFADQRAARFGAEEALRQGYQTDESSRIARMQSYGDLGNQVMNIQNQVASGLIGVGEAQRILDQRALDLAYSDYVDQRMYPQEQINFALGALSGVPYPTTSRSYQTSQTMAANPSVFGQALAALGQLYSGYKLSQ